MIIWEIIGGLFGGLVGGMGMGGGTLLIPIITLLAGFKQLEAQGINLISFIPMSMVALILQQVCLSFVQLQIMVQDMTSPTDS